MDRFIANPVGLTFDDLQNNDWDLIKLNITFDTTSAMAWVKEVEEKNQDCIWKWTEAAPYVDEDLLKHLNAWVSKQLEKSETQEPEQWALQWSYQRDGVLPFEALASKKVYPEVADPNFLQIWNQNLEKYMFGFWKKYYDALGETVFPVSRLVKFPKGCGLGPHIDTGPDQQFLIRMHTIPDLGPEHYFAFGKKSEQRRYYLEPGCTYLLNTGVPHCAINRDEKDWWMLHNNPTPDGVNKVLGTTAHFE
jgi:hypothetical protein